MYTYIILYPFGLNYGIMPFRFQIQAAPGTRASLGTVPALIWISPDLSCTWLVYYSYGICIEYGTDMTKHDSGMLLMSSQ